MVTSAALSCIFFFISPLFVDAATRQSAVFAAAAATRQSGVTRETEAERLVRRDMEADKYLAKVNRPYVKSFTTPYGDILDCVRLEVLYPNHTIPIRMRPPWEPEKPVGVGDYVHEVIFRHKEDECPNGTVPVRRTMKENVLNFDPIELYGRKDPSYASYFESRMRNHVP